MTISEQLKLYEEDIEKICKRNNVNDEDTKELTLMVQHICWELHKTATSGRAMETLFKKYTNKEYADIYNEYIEEVKKEEEKFPFECKELLEGGEE